MKRFLITTALLLQACGQQPTATDPNAKDATQKGGEIVHASPDPKQIVTEYKKSGATYALSVDSSSDLPTCDLSNTKQLAYVKTEDTFYNCNGETKVWETVSIKGSKGDKGDLGPTGPQGPSGSPATPIPPNQWYDPITGNSWLIGGSANYASTATFTQACVNGWRLPTRAEGIAAGNHGIKSASAIVSGPADMWTSEVPVGFETTQAFTVQLNPQVMEVSKPQTESHGIMCIKQ